jgi:hypothetical protein
MKRYVRYSVLQRNVIIADVYLLSSNYIQREPRRGKGGVWVLKRGVVSA